MAIEPEANNVPEQALAVLCEHELATLAQVDAMLADMKESDRWRFWIVTQKKITTLAQEMRSVAWKQYGVQAALRTVLQNIGIPYKSPPESIKKLIDEHMKVKSIEHILSLKFGRRKLRSNLPILGGRHHIE